MKNEKPIIGIILDWQKEGSFATRPYYAMETDYFKRIKKAGGIPVAIPLEDEFIDDYLNNIDGLLDPGGFFKYPEEFYIDGNTAIKQEPLERPDFEKKLIKKAVDIDMPYLGICAGMQSLCGSLGGKMHRNLNTVYNTKITHYKTPATKPAHSINITKGSLLHNIIGDTILNVNSAHNESIAEVPNDIIVTATSDDGVIEAIEMPSKKFVLGVQWHPEFFIEDNSPHLEIFKSFIKASKNG